MPISVLHLKMPQLSPLYDLTSFFVGVPIFIIAHLLRVLSLLKIEKKFYIYHMMSGLGVI